MSLIFNILHNWHGYCLSYFIVWIVFVIMAKIPASRFKRESRLIIGKPSYLTNREITMNTEISSKKDIYQAVGFTLLLVALSLPLSILGMQLLNFVLGKIQV
jgi:hypothetical protein